MLVFIIVLSMDHIAEWVEANKNWVDKKSRPPYDAQIVEWKNMSSVNHKFSLKFGWAFAHPAPIALHIL